MPCSALGIVLCKKGGKRGKVALFKLGGVNDSIFSPPFHSLSALFQKTFSALDTRLGSQACSASEYILYGSTGVLCFMMLIKFLAAMQLGKKPSPENQDKFVILQVPCYTEGEDSLRKTIDSLSTLHYDDTRKLLFLIADGMIKGAGNELATPEIVMKILNVDPSAGKRGRRQESWTYLIKIQSQH